MPAPRPSPRRSAREGRASTRARSGSASCVSQRRCTAPGTCPFRYSSSPQRSSKGRRYQRQSTTRTFGSSRCSASHSVDTSGLEVGGPAVIGRHAREQRWASRGACGSSRCSRSRASSSSRSLAEREGAEVCFLADEGTDRDLYVALDRGRARHRAHDRRPGDHEPLLAPSGHDGGRDRDARRARAGSGVARPRRRRQPRARPARSRPRTALHGAARRVRAQPQRCSVAPRSARPGCPGRRSRCRSRSPGAALGCRRSRPPKPTGSCCPPRRRPRSRARLTDSARTAARSRGPRTSRTRPSNGSGCSATSPTWRSTRRPRSASAPASPTSASTRSAPRCCPDASTRRPRSSPTRWSTSTRSQERPTTVRGASPPSRRASTCSCSR